MILSLLLKGNGCTFSYYSILAGSHVSSAVGHELAENEVLVVTGTVSVLAAYGIFSKHARTARRSSSSVCLYKRGNALVTEPNQPYGTKRSVGFARKSFAFITASTCGAGWAILNQPLRVQNGDTSTAKCEVVHSDASWNPGCVADRQQTAHQRPALCGMSAFERSIFGISWKQREVYAKDLFVLPVTAF
eukprot:6170699-Pleurochrysis_carterae.AAC.3